MPGTGSPSICASRSPVTFVAPSRPLGALAEPFDEEAGAVDALDLGLERMDDLAFRLALLAFTLGLLALADYVRRAIVIGQRHSHSQEQRK